MNVSFRDRKTQVAVGAFAVAVVVAFYIVMPLASKWSELGTQLDPKLTQVAQLRAQVLGQEALKAKRDALAKRMGSLLGRPASADVAKNGPAGDKPAGAKGPGSAKPESGAKETKDAKNPADKSGQTPAPATGKAAEAAPGKPGATTPTTPGASPAAAAKAAPSAPSAASPATPASSPAIAAAPPAAGSPVGDKAAPKEKPVDGKTELAAAPPVPAGAPGAAKDASAKDATAKDKPAEAPGEKTPAMTLAAAGAAGKPGDDKARPAATATDGARPAATATDGARPAATATDKTAAAPGGKPGDAKTGSDKSKAASGDKGASSPEAAKGDERLAAYFERSAAQAGIKIKRVSSKKGGAGKNKYFTPITLQLSIEGKADNVVKLLYALEKGDRFVRVEQFELHRDVAKGNSIEASMDILGYERL